MGKVALELSLGGIYVVIRRHLMNRITSPDNEKGGIYNGKEVLDKDRQLTLAKKVNSHRQGKTPFYNGLHAFLQSKSHNRLEDFYKKTQKNFASYKKNSTFANA